MRLVCEQCGHANPGDATFCERCDEYLGWTARQVPDAPAARPAPQGGPPAGQPPAQARPLAQAPAQQAQYPAPAAHTTPLPPVSSTQPIGPPVPSGHPAGGVPGGAVQGRGTDVLLPAEADRTCPACAVTNPPHRRFCRHCGAWLVEAGGVPPAPYQPWYRSWWRRLIGPRGRAERAAYRRSLSPVTRAFRIAVALLAVLLALALFSPPFGSPLGWARDQIGHLQGSGRIGKVPARPLAAAPGPTAPARERAAYTAEARNVGAAVDDVRGTAWTAPWSRDAAPESPAECGAQATVPRRGFVVTFPRPVDVREIGLQSGVVGDKSSWLPRTVHLRWTPATPADGDSGAGAARPVCRPVTLEETTDLQRFRVTEGRVLAVEVVVVTAFPPAEPRDDSRLRLGEVIFWER